MIKAQGLSKIYSGVAAVADIDLTVDRGQVLGLVGTNGAGRTTLLRILATQLKPTSGQIEIDGINALRHPFRARPKIGYIGQTQSFYDSMNVGEFLKFVASCQNEKLDKAAILTAQPFDGLNAEMPLRTLSHGSRQKLALAAVLIHRPSLLILDEPMTYLDPVAVRQFHAMVKSFQLQGGTIVMACNRTEDIPDLCDVVAFMDRGRILQTIKLAGLGINIAETFVELIEKSGSDRNPISSGTKEI
jgi:ABC-2 type transport system ATP-binding protein